MIKPLADRVVIEPKEAETKTASGLYIPDTAKEKPQQGKVVAAGPGKKDEPMELKVGDVVLYGKYAGTEVTVDDKTYLIMKQSDVLGNGIRIRMRDPDDKGTGRGMPVQSGFHLAAGRPAGAGPQHDFQISNRPLCGCR